METITGEASPSTVGLFGEWGVGKSTILDDVERRLPDDTAFVYFDAWRYEGESLRRFFLRHAAGELKADGLLSWRYRPKSELRELEFDVQLARLRLIASIATLAPALISAIVAGAIIYGALQIEAVDRFLFGPEAKPSAVITAAAALAIFAANLAGRILQPLPEVLASRRLEDPERFISLFSRLLGALKSKRLVVAIDNLDRCSPSQALAMLATIKTYLEPAAERVRSKDVVFVIAVDDRALKRHLLTRELARAPADGEPGESDQQRASDYVEEYLRKLFNAVLRIKPLLRGDMREYIVQELEPFCHFQELDEQTAAELVAMVHQVFRSNPRRINQFVNNLGLRMALIRTRESETRQPEPAIRPPISRDVRLITKLALIEERWPAHYARLAEHPELFAEWHRLAAEGGDPMAAGIEGDSATADPARIIEWATLSVFLEATREVFTRNARPYIHYKQSREERELPGLSAFRESIVAGDATAVEELLAGDSGNLDAYRRRLPDLLREQVEIGWHQGARAILAVSLRSETLSADRNHIRDLVDAALRAPALHRLLPGLPPRPLFEAANGLDAARKGLARRAVITALSSDSPDQRLEAAQVLAAHRDEWSADEKSRIRAWSEKGPLLDDWAALRALAEAEPEAVSRPALDLAATTLRQSSPRWHGVADDNLFAVLLTAVRQGEQETAILGAAATALGEPEDELDVELILARLRELAAVHEGATAQDRRILVSVAVDALSVQPDERLLPILEWGMELTAGDEGRPESEAGSAIDGQKALLTAALARPRVLLAWLEAHGHELGRPVQQWLAEVLSEMVRDRPEWMQPLLEGIRGLSPPQWETRRASIAESICREGTAAAVHAAFAHRELLGTSAGQLVDLVIQRLETAHNESDIDLARLVVDQIEPGGSERRKRLVEALTTKVRKAPPPLPGDALALVGELMARPEWAAPGSALMAEAIDRATAGGRPDRVAEMVRGLLAAERNLSGDLRQRLRDRLSRLIAQVEVWPGLAQVIAASDYVPADPSEFAAELLTAEQAQQDLGIRTALLEAAHRVDVGGRALTRRLAELQSSTDRDDQAVLARVETTRKTG